MSAIQTFNSAVSNAVNKNDADYIAIIGTEDFVPEATIVDSGDFNCGALCNELEFAKAVSDYYAVSFDLDIAETENLSILINSFIDLPRRSESEPDALFRSRFRAIVTQKLNGKRTTPWAIRDALSYFIADIGKIDVVEPFGRKAYFFEVRIEGTATLDETIFLDNPDIAYVSQNFIGGIGVGGIITFLDDIVSRIKAAGIDFDILLIARGSVTKTSDATIGSVQITKLSNAVIRRIESFTKLSDATVV